MISVCTHCVCVLTVVQGKLQSFLVLAAQTLESFVRSLDEDGKAQTEDHNSQEHQFVLALAGTITSEFTASVQQQTHRFIFDTSFTLNIYQFTVFVSHQSDIAAVTCGRDFLSSSAHIILDTLMKLLELMKPGVFPKLKVYVELWQNT